MASGVRAGSVRRRSQSSSRFHPSWVGRFVLAAIADVEEVAQSFDCLSLLAFAEKRRDWNAEKLSEQIEQCSFDGSDCVDGDAVIESLQSTSAGIAIGELRADGIEDGVKIPGGFADDERAGIFERLANTLAAGNFADSGMSGAVSEDDEVADEIRAMRAAEIEQHAVVARDGDHAHCGDGG